MSEPNLASAIHQSQSWRAVCKILGRYYDNSRIKRLKAQAEAEGISTEHFLGKAIWKGKSAPDRWIDSSKGTSGNRLKLKLFREGKKDERCETCMLSEWMDQPIPLQLHHVNGEKTDDRIENLQILCANCHAQTPNFAAKNLKHLRSRSPTVEAIVSEAIK